MNKNLMAASVALCSRALHVEETLRIRVPYLRLLPLFCLMCRHAYSRTLCRECMLFSDREGAKFTIKSRRTPCAREEIGGNDVFMIHVSLKTEEDPDCRESRSRRFPGYRRREPRVDARGNEHSPRMHDCVRGHGDRRQRREQRHSRWRALRIRWSRVGTQKFDRRGGKA